MDTSLRRKAQQILTDVAQLSAAEQEAKLLQLCGDDAALLAHVRELLSATLEADRVTLAETLPHTPIDERPGAQIGPYKLLQQIGEGGFGAVFMAEQERPVRRKVALKVIKLGMDTRQVVARFEQERQALALMDHPNIAKVFDAGATD